MEIRFIGPLGKVTGSCTWMRDIDRGWDFLIDCGMQQGEPTAKAWNSCEEWPFEPSALKFMVLTHAHTDHSGLIPELYKRGFNGTVYCTKETRDVAMLLLRDAAQFTETTYEETDLDAIKWHTPGPGGETMLGAYHPVDTDLFIQFFRSGHITGAASVKVLWGPKGSGQRSVIFSGDIGPGSDENEVLPFLRYPMHPEKGTFAVLESTYGSIIRDANDKDPIVRRNRLKELLDQILGSGGTLAIPAFAVGRTQDLLFDMHYVVASDPNRYQPINFLLDGPSAKRMNEITAKALRVMHVTNHNGKVRPLWLGKQVFRDLGLEKNQPIHVHFALDVCDMTFGVSRNPIETKPAVGNKISQRWKGVFTVVKDRMNEINKKNSGPRVIIMGSGTGDGGPAASWLPELLKTDSNIVAMSGYCSPDTIGGKLLKLQHVEPNDRAYFSNELVWQKKENQAQSFLPICDVRAKITQLSGYSGHGDQADLLNWLFELYKGHTRQLLARTVFLQHGEDYARNALADAIKEKSLEYGLASHVIKPDDPSKWFDLEQELGFDEGDIKDRKAELEERIRRDQEALDKMNLQTDPGNR